MLIRKAGQVAASDDREQTLRRAAARSSGAGESKLFGQLHELPFQMRRFSLDREHREFLAGRNCAETTPRCSGRTHGFLRVIAASLIVRFLRPCQSGAVSFASSSTTGKPLVDSAQRNRDI